MQKEKVHSEKEYIPCPAVLQAFQENDIMLAVQYADNFANTFRRPVVFCLGLVTNSGDQSGSSALSRYMEFMAVNAVVR